MAHAAIETMKALPRPPAGGGPFVMNAELRPHRSLPNWAFRMLIGVLVVAMGLAGAFYALTGAWPVLGFFGLDLLLILWAFRASYKAGTMRERVRVAGDGVWVTRHHPTGHRQDFYVPATTLRIDLVAAGRHEAQLRLVSRGAVLILGHFLPPDERTEFGTALQKAVERARLPQIAPLQEPLTE